MQNVLKRSRAKLQSEIERAREGGRSELLDTLIVYEWKTLFGPFRDEPATVTPVSEVDTARDTARETER